MAAPGRATAWSIAASHVHVDSHVLPRAGRLIVKHEEIRGFMGAIEMSFPVTPPSLLNGLNAGDSVQFSIDAARSAITSIEVVESAR